jgi:hypothetical protein
MFDRARLLVQTGLYLGAGAVYGLIRAVAAPEGPTLAGALLAVDVQFLVPAAAAALGAALRPVHGPGRPWAAAGACALAFALTIALAWALAGLSGAVSPGAALGAAGFGALRAAVAGLLGTFIGAQLRSLPGRAASDDGAP